MGARNASGIARSPNSTGASNTGASNASANSTLAKQHEREQHAAHRAQPIPTPVNRRDCTLYNKSLQLVQMAPPLDLPEPFL